jgi:gamma-glutamylcyclotransferase
MEHWYFAYGSNLLQAQMVARLGKYSEGIEQSRLARLPGYRVVFTMRDSDGQFYGNIEPSDEDVLGVVYRCTDEALSKLDVFEAGYDRREVMVFDQQQVPLKAIVYIAQPTFTQAGGWPSLEYLDRIVSGARNHQLPTEYIAKLIAIATESPSPQAKMS